MFESVEREARFSGLLEALESLENNKAVRNNIEDIIDIFSLHDYAQGMKMGAHLTSLLNVERLCP